MKYHLIDEEQPHHAVSRLARVLGMSRGSTLTTTRVQGRCVQTNDRIEPQIGVAVSVRNVHDCTYDEHKQNKDEDMVSSRRRPARGSVREQLPNRCSGHAHGQHGEDGPTHDPEQGESLEPRRVATTIGDLLAHERLAHKRAYLLAHECV